MSAIILTVTIPKSLFDWLEEAIKVGEYDSFDSIIVTAVERLRITQMYLTQLEQWAAEFSHSKLARLAEIGDTPQSAQPPTQSQLARMAEARATYMVTPYDSAYFAAMDELSSPITILPRTTVDISGFVSG